MKFLPKPRREGGGETAGMTYTQAKAFLKSLSPDENAAFRRLREIAKTGPEAASRIANLRRHQFGRWLYEHNRIGEFF